MFECLRLYIIGTDVQSEIIARGPNEYNWFINPLIVFNGDRVSFTKTYVRKKTLAAQKKATLSGSVTSVGGEKLAKTPVTNVSQGLAGRLPGVVAVSNTSEPGYDGATITVRGYRNSISDI